MFDHDSKISYHVHENNHHMDFNAVSVVGHEPDYHKRLFLEAWLSIKDPHSGNDHAIIPEVYKSLSCAWVSRHVPFFQTLYVIFKARANVLPF